MKITLGLLLCACLVAAGCSRGDAPVDSGDRAQVFHRGIGADLSDLDPQLATLGSDYTVLSSLMEGLVAEDPVDLHPVPGVAENWNQSADGLTYTFYLRADARWSNGDPVTAADFIASWHRMLSPKLGASNASQLYVIQGAEAFNRGAADFSTVGLKAPSPRVLVVVLEHPAPWFLSLLCGTAWMPVPIATIGTYGALDERGNPWAQPGRWVGNGPFNLVSWKHGQEIVVSRSATYWDRGHVTLSEIHFHAFDSVDAEERAFRAGQLHVTEALPPGKVDSYRKDAPDLLHIDPLLGTYFLRLNVRKPGLDDPRVRLALALAVDRQGLVDRVLRGGQVPADEFTPAGLGGYSSQPAQRQHLEEATRLLAEAGHAGGQGLPEFELLFNSSETHKLIAEALQEMWRRDLGVKVRLTNADLKTIEDARRSGAFEILRSSWIAEYADPSSFLDVFRSDSGNNFTGWANADYDALLFKAERTPDAAERNGLYARAESLLLSEAPVVCLYHYTHVYLMRPSVKGWHPTLLDHHPYKAISLGP